MHLVFLFGILSVLFAGLTSGGKIIHQAKNLSRRHNNSEDLPSFVIHQYIGRNTISDDSFEDLDEKLKRIIALLQDKVGMPRNEGRSWNYQLKFLYFTVMLDEIYEADNQRKLI